MAAAFLMETATWSSSRRPAEVMKRPLRDGEGRRGVWMKEGEGEEGRRGGEERGVWRWQKQEGGRKKPIETRWEHGVGRRAEVGGMGGDAEKT